MFGFFGKSPRWGISELKHDLLINLRVIELPGNKQKELLNKLVRTILKAIYVNNYHKFNEIEREMLNKIFDNTSTASLIDIEDYLRKKIRRYDKNAKKALDEYYEEHKKFLKEFGHIFKP